MSLHWHDKYGIVDLGGLVGNFIFILLRWDRWFEIFGHGVVGLAAVGWMIWIGFLDGFFDSGSMNWDRWFGILGSRS